MVCDDCAIQPALTAELVAEVRAWLREFAIAAYDEESHSGVVRYLMLRDGRVSGEWMLVLVTLERDHGRIVDEMIACLKREPEVMDLWYVTGEQDFVLQVAARDMQSYEQFTRRVLHAREQVRSFKTLVVMGQHKRCGALLPV